MSHATPSIVGAGFRLKIYVVETHFWFVVPVGIGQFELQVSRYSEFNGIILNYNKIFTMHCVEARQ